MKFSKSRENKKPRPFSQTSGGDMLVGKIYAKKRGMRDSRAIVRKYQGWFKKIIIFLIVVGFLGYVFYKLDLVRYLEISGVEIIGAGEFVNEANLKVLVESNSLGCNIFLFDPNSLEETLAQNFLEARAIEVEKKYPDKIRILVEERVPLAILYKGSGSEKYLIDSEGYVLEAVGNKFSSLPRIIYEGDITIGEFLDEDLVPVSAEILRFAESEEVRVSSMSFYPKYVRLYVNGSVDTYIGGKKDIKESLKTIGALLKKTSLEGKKLIKIDLRYDKVIVLYE